MLWLGVLKLTECRYRICVTVLCSTINKHMENKMIHKLLQLHINNASDTGYKSKYYRDMLVELGLSCTLFCIFGYILYAVWHIF